MNPVSVCLMLVCQVLPTNTKTWNQSEFAEAIFNEAKNGVIVTVEDPTIKNQMPRDVNKATRPELHDIPEDARIGESPNAEWIRRFGFTGDEIKSFVESDLRNNGIKVFRNNKEALDAVDSKHPTIFFMVHPTFQRIGDIVSFSITISIGQMGIRGTKQQLQIGMCAIEDAKTTQLVSKEGTRKLFRDQLSSLLAQMAQSIQNAKIAEDVVSVDVLQMIVQDQPLDIDVNSTLKHCMTRVGVRVGHPYFVYKGSEDYLLANGIKSESIRKAIEVSLRKYGCTIRPVSDLSLDWYEMTISPVIAILPGPAGSSFEDLVSFDIQLVPNVPFRLPQAADRIWIGEMLQATPDFPKAARFCTKNIFRREFELTLDELCVFATASLRMK